MIQKCFFWCIFFWWGVGGTERSVIQNTTHSLQELRPAPILLVARHTGSCKCTLPSTPAAHLRPEARQGLKPSRRRDSRTLSQSMGLSNGLNRRSRGTVNSGASDQSAAVEWLQALTTVHQQSLNVKSHTIPQPTSCPSRLNELDRLNRLYEHFVEACSPFCGQPRRDACRPLQCTAIIAAADCQWCVLVATLQLAAQRH